MENRLYRSSTERMIFGVCGGLAKYLGIDPTIIRIIFILLAFSGVGILAYFVMAFIVPLESSKKEAPKEVIEENVEDIKETATKLGYEIRDTFAGRDKDKTEEEVKIQERRRNALGIIIIVVGVICLLGALNIFHWINWWGTVGAIVLIGLGVLLIVGLRRSK
jgi:phage shock protein PspC (stress-responsive transcriptional regulator)